MALIGWSAMKSLFKSIYAGCRTVLWVGCGLSLAHASQVSSDFSDGLGLWEQSATGTWEIQNQSGNDVAALTAAGTQPGGVRRPTGYLLMPSIDWTDTTIDLRARTLEPESVVNRDVVVIFGYVDETHFYYTHLSSNSDDRFHTIIMKVNGTERETIDLQTAPPAPLTDAWHDVRVIHESNGSIRVYVDDMETPVMTAEDTTYPVGSVGFGCFDDRALFDDVRISGTARAK